MRALLRLQRESKPSLFVFVSERGSPFTTARFAKMIWRVSRRGLGIELNAHPHMLRHACGYALATRGTTRGRFRGDWGASRSLRRRSNTVLAPNRFKDFWRE
jgi:integrase